MDESGIQGIRPLNDGSRENQIRQRLSETEILLASTDIEVEVSNAIRLPLDQIPSLGVGLGSLPEIFRSITTTADTPTLLQAFDKSGNPLSPSVLNVANDGSGMIGSYTDAVAGLSQARFQEADLGVTTMPYDPTALFMAAALAQINQKLDAIQKTVDEMFEYLRQKDEAELRGNVRTLEDTLEAYRHNWNNDIWRQNAHMKVLDIKQESEKSIVHLRAQIKKKLGGKKLLEIRPAVQGRLDEVLDRLKEYQLATYTYSFAAFLEPMLSENYDAANLTSIAAKIGEHGNEYRELYTQCYDAIEEGAERAADSKLLEGVGAALSGLGGLVGKTPIGDRTPLDDALQDAGEGVGKLNEELTQGLMRKLLQAKTPDVLPFKQSLESVNALHNQPHQLAADREYVYLLPQ